MYTYKYTSKHTERSEVDWKRVVSHVKTERGENKYVKTDIEVLISDAHIWKETYIWEEKSSHTSKNTVERLQHTATQGNTLQNTATHTATYRKTLPHVKSLHALERRTRPRLPRALGPAPLLGASAKLARAMGRRMQPRLPTNIRTSVALGTLRIDTGHCVKIHVSWQGHKYKILLYKKARSQADMMNLRVSAKSFTIRGVLAKKHCTNSKCKKPSHTPAYFWPSLSHACHWLSGSGWSLSQGEGVASDLDATRFPC